ncbi:MAG: peptidylprolyl isomerase [Acidimicrobiia bacterium]|nr:peptidylprolyl isomerase [Acidimicrobiia bacterium]
MPPRKDVALEAPSFEDDPQIDPDKTYTVVMATSCGDMTFALDPVNAPEDVNNFVYLANQGFFDGTIFHRVINGFMIQGGDPMGPDPTRAGMGGPGYQYTGSTPPPPADGSSTYQVGSLAMANSEGPSTNSSQFFVVSGPQGEALPPNYSLFGQMTAGLDVLDRIQNVPTNEKDYPVSPVVVNTVTVTES